MLGCVLNHLQKTIENKDFNIGQLLPVLSATQLLAGFAIR